MGTNIVLLVTVEYMMGATEKLKQMLNRLLAYPLYTLLAVVFIDY